MQTNESTKTLFRQPDSNTLFIRMKEGEFEVSNPEAALLKSWEGDWIRLDDRPGIIGEYVKVKPEEIIEWPGEVELIKMCASDVCNTDGACEHCREPKTVARLIPKEEKKEPSESQEEMWKTVLYVIELCKEKKCDPVISLSGIFNLTRKPELAMEKPDFEALADKKCPPKAYPEAWGGFVAACEHVWNAYVVPLESENKLLRDQIAGLKNICEMDRKTEYQYTQLLKEKEALIEEIERLKAQQMPKDAHKF